MHLDTCQFDVHHVPRSSHIIEGSSSKSQTKGFLVTCLYRTFSTHIFILSICSREFRLSLSKQRQTTKLARPYTRAYIQTGCSGTHVAFIYVQGARCSAVHLKFISSDTGGRRTGRIPAGEGGPARLFLLLLLLLGPYPNPAAAVRPARRTKE